MRDAVERVLITGARSPGARHLAWGLRAAGACVHMADSLPTWCGADDTPAFAFHRLPPAATQGSDHAHTVVELTQALGFTSIIPFNEDALHLARWGKEALGPRLRTPSFATMLAAHNKATFVDLCARAGTAAPRSVVLSPTTLRAWPIPLDETVAKPVWSRFGSDVIVRPTEPQLDLLGHERRPWLLQERIRGEEFCATALCDAGRVVGLCVYQGRQRAGVGASVCFESVDSAPFEQDVARFVAATGWDGLVGFDVIRRDGVNWFIECNPRGTSGVHFFEDSQSLRAGFAGYPVQVSRGKRMVGPAMLAFALPTALMQGKLRGWWRDWSSAQEANAVFGPPAHGAMVRTTAALMLQNRWRGPLGASTADIVWDGTVHDDQT